jgi:hypothetical protein
MKKKLVYAGVSLAVAVLAFVGYANLRAHQVAGSFLRAVIAGKEVRVEHFLAGWTAKKVSLSNEDRRLVAEVFGFVSSPPGVSYLRCFVPHHRIVATTAAGEENEVLICFQCSQIRFRGDSIRSMPTQWEAGLKELFARFAIPASPPPEEGFLRIQEQRSASTQKSEPPPTVPR